MPTEQANLDDCGVFSTHNAIMYMNDQPFQTTKNSAEALEFARRTRWWFQELISDRALNTEESNERSEAAPSGHGIVPDVDNGERAQARIDALSKITRKETRRDQEESCCNC